MRRPITHLAAAATLAAVVLTGCGSGSGARSTSSEDPKAAFSTGLQGLTDKDALTVTVKLDTTPDKLLGFAKESKGKLTAQEAQKIASAQLVFETKTTDGSSLSKVQAGSTNKAATRFAIEDNGQTLATLLSLDNALYAQADVHTLLDLANKKTAYADLTKRAAQMPDFVRAFVKGEWVSLDLNALKAIAGQFGANASTNPQQTQKLITDLKADVNKDVTVTRVGTDSDGDHLKVTTQSRTFFTDLVQTIRTDIPAAGLATGSFKPESVPDHSIVVDAWVKDGAVSKLSLDVVQFAKPSEVKPGDSLPVVLQFDRSGDAISTPSNATPIDTTKLFTLLGALGTK